MTKRVYIFDGPNNSFTGFWNCQESPLEPGVFIQPVASTEVEPPTFSGETHTCCWDGSKWVVNEIPTPAPAPVPAPVPQQDTTTPTVV
jgi:hypothetical protein